MIEDVVAKLNISCGSGSPASDDSERALHSITFEPSHSYNGSSLGIIERFGQAMRENVANGEIPFRETCLQTAIDQIEVDDHVIRIIGDTATLEQVVDGKSVPAPGFAVWYASGALREIRTPRPSNS